MLLALTGCGVDGDAGLEGGRHGSPGADRLEGELDVFIINYDEGASETQYTLRVSEEEHLDLELQLDDPPELATGDKVIVHGVRLDDVFLVESLSFANTDSDVGVARQALTGNRVRTRARLAALMVHWGSPDSTTAATLRSRLFTNTNSTAAWNRENSYDLHETTGDVFGWLRISAPSGCDYRTIATRARTAASNAGINLNNYEQVLYYFPRTSACGWSGLASVGRPTRPARDTWYNGSSGCVVLAQELLHNFGALHSRSYTCRGGRSIATPSNCSYSEYGDRFDPMGGGCFHTNNYQKSAQGWFGGCNVTTVSGSGTFDVVPTQRASNSIQALRIPMASSLCPSGMSSCFYTVEYRQPVGVIEGGNSANNAVYRGVLIHVAPPVDFTGNGRPANPYLLDMNPSTSTFNDAPLPVGATFQDPNGIRITLVSANSTAARVRIERPGVSDAQARCIDGSTPGGGGNVPSDTTPPVVTPVSPANNATLPMGTIQVVATVTDNEAVAGADLIWSNGENTFTIDCATAQSPFGCTRSGTTYTWTIEVGVTGTRTWQVRGRDTSGNESTSSTRTIQVTDPVPATPPTIQPVSPAHGALLAPNSTIQVSANVTATAGVSRVELLWWNDDNTLTFDCATTSGPVQCARSGDTYTWSIQVGEGRNRWWRVRAIDTGNRETLSPWSLIDLR